MHELTHCHFLKISGLVERNQALQFEHTVKSAFGLILHECLEKKLSVGAFARNEYHFFSSWLNEEALRRFTHSEEYQLIRSAYDALGRLQKIEIAYDVELKIIRIS